MRKLISVVLISILLLTAAFSLAETATSEIQGLWYMTQFISGETAFSCEDTAKLLTCDFKEDGTCDYCLNDDHYNASWMDNGDGTYIFLEDEAEEPVGMRMEDGYLLMGDEFDYYIFSREPFKPREFAKPVAVEQPYDFNGKYELCYVSGDGFSVGIDEAAGLLEDLGVMDPTLDIYGCDVQFLGQLDATFEFDKNEGTLNVTYSYEGFEPQSIKIVMLDDGNIAIDWVGMTFYAERLED